MKNKIYPCLWFDGNAKEAAEFYTSVFDNSKITADSPIVVIFESAGQKFMCLNGGPHFTMNPSISFFIVCETEEETDRLWKSLSKDGSVLMSLDKYDWSPKYGWLQDRFGVSWQIAWGNPQDVGQKFTPSFLFTGAQNGNAERAVNFYISVFDNSEIVGIMHYEKGQHDIEGNVAHAQFKLDGQVFMAMDSSLDHKFGFNEGISMVIDCENQDQIDYYWNKLTLGGEESQCGWLKDQFGVSWQVVPTILDELMSDPARSQRVVDAFMKMKKFDIETLVTA
jgi:predicted 3-demethylubiquinone-9 3-methyltransferase (glyoxalase superfamily)